jgi:transcriptional regulator with XRE-family HTH domain
MGTGGALSLAQLQRATHSKQNTVPLAEVTDAQHIRSPSENLSCIREVLKPSISDLAITLGVSRQSVYNWLHGEPVTDENAAKLQDLAQACDVLVNGGVPVNAALLKRKFANGRTLLQVAQVGESAREAALMLIHIHQQEATQRERINARFANRAKTPATADFDLPASNDQA